jgi:pyridoxal 5'-phosphate synthase pdxT subunit
VYTIGVIALQGDISEHVVAMRRALGDKGIVVEVRKAGEIPECDGLVIPGGESTTIFRQLEKSGMIGELKDFASSGKPILATCAGLVLVSSTIEGDSRMKPLGLMDTTVDRNAFGSQKNSFEANLAVEGFKKPYRAVFIRAPVISDVGKAVHVLARVEDKIVAARQGNVLCLAFHPELTEDRRFHQMFLSELEA